MTNWHAWMACGLLMSLPAAAQGEIFRWDNGQLIPGAEGITPRPGVDLSSFFGEWSSPERNLRFADFTGGLDLTEANFAFSWLDNSRFDGAILTNADLSGTNLTNAWLGGANLTNANLSGTNLTDAVLWSASLTNANFAEATVTEASFHEATSRGFTKEQLYSTASYQQRNLRGIELSSNDLTGGDFSGQDLTDADFYYSTLTNADLSGANLTNAYLGSATLTNANLAGAVVAGAGFGGVEGSGITLPQLYSTASYQQRILRGIGLSGHDLTSGNFSGQDLTGAFFWGSTLTNANLSGTNLTDAVLTGANLTNANLAGAMVTGANFGHAPSRGFTKEQLYSTGSYQQRNLRGIGLSGHDLTSGNFSGQDLTGAFFWGSTLTNANLSGTNLTDALLGGATLTNANLAGAIVTGADFQVTTWQGFTKEQLYSTASYQQKNLRGIGLLFNNLTGWDFSGQDLSGATLVGTTLTSANFAGAVVTGADFHSGGGYFEGPGGSGITLPQLYSTASYRQKNLRGIGLSGHNLTAWDFSGQDLAGAVFTFSQLTNANFSFADLRGALLPSSGPIQLARNTIRELGAINGLDLAAGETLIVRDSDMGITVNDSMNAVSGGTLELVLSDADWGSTMTVEAGVTPDLGGILRIRFVDQANLASMLGTTFDFFDWPEVLDTNNRFEAIELPPGTQWDFSQLYATGTAKLTAIPEPSAVLLYACGAAVCALNRRVTNNHVRGGDVTLSQARMGLGNRWFGGMRCRKSFVRQFF